MSKPDIVNLTPANEWHTPDSQDELFAWIDMLSEDEQTTATTAVCMAWNLAAKLTKDNVSNAAQWCHDMALALDKNKGNEQLIARAIVRAFELPDLETDNDTDK